MADKLGMFYPLESDDERAIIPGNALLFQHKNAAGTWTRTGHISILLRVDDDAEEFNTVGGNEGNRVKVGNRSRKRSKDLIGFINPFPSVEQQADFERGLIVANSVDKLSTR